MWITCGLLWCFYQLFGLSFWRHPFTPEDPLLSKWCNTRVNFSKSVLMQKHLIYILYGLREYIFHFPFLHFLGELFLQCFMHTISFLLNLWWNKILFWKQSCKVCACVLCVFRSCTDIICCVLFMLVIAGYMVVGILGKFLFISLFLCLSVWSSVVVSSCLCLVSSLFSAQTHTYCELCVYWCCVYFDLKAIWKLNSVCLP